MAMFDENNLFPSWKNLMLKVVAYSHYVYKCVGFFDQNFMLFLLYY